MLRFFSLGAAPSFSARAISLSCDALRLQSLKSIRVNPLVFDKVLIISLNTLK